MSELKKCPCCGYEAALETMIVRKGWEADIQCLACPLSLHTVTCDTEEEAIIAATSTWNRRTEPEKKPLTLEELSCMHGEPIYIVEKEIAHDNRWEILDENIPVDWNLQDVNLKGGDAYPTYTCGKTWLAYRHKPKEE